MALQAISFTATISSGSASSGAVTLSTPVPENASVPIFSVRGGPGDNPRQTAVMPTFGGLSGGEYANITFDLSGGGTTADVNISGYVLYGDDLTVTTYTGTHLFATDGDTKNVTISTIDTTKDFLVLYANGGANAYSRATMRGHFTTTTNMQLYRGNLGSSDMNYTAYVCRIAGATVQASLVTIETAVNSGLYGDMSLSTIDQSKTFFIYNMTNEATATNSGRYYTEARFTSNTNLRFTRYADGGAGWESRISAYVITHPNLVVEQTDSVTAVSATSTNDTLATTFADDGSRWIVPGNVHGNGQVDTTTSATLDYGLNTHAFTSTTQITMTRVPSTNTLTVTSQAVKWQAPGNQALKKYVLQLT